MKKTHAFLQVFRSQTFFHVWGNLRAGLMIFLQPRVLLPAAVFAALFLCSTVYADIRSFAPAAAREFPTATPTAFRPATKTPFDFHRLSRPAPTASATPTPAIQMRATFDPARPWAPYAGPVRPASTQIPTPAEEFDPQPDVLNIALLGVDSLDAGEAFRTDTIMVLSLNRAASSAALISFPRDLFVFIPAYGMQRINLAFQQGKDLPYSGGGFALLRDTMKYNFGISIGRYVLMDFLGFKDMIDSLDGIDLYVPQALTDFRLGHGTFTIPEGDAHMDGYTALWYARSRRTTSDFDRQRRQQEVLQAVAQRLLNLNALGDIPGFFQAFRQYVESDLTLDDLAPYIGLAFSLDPSAVERYGITAPKGCRGWTSPEGMMVLLPDYDAIRTMLKNVLLPQGPVAP
jgi:LCP family protein required for cell wall assembly